MLKIYTGAEAFLIDIGLQNDIKDCDEIIKCQDENQVAEALSMVSLLGEKKAVIYELPTLKFDKTLEELMPLIMEENNSILIIKVKDIDKRTKAYSAYKSFIVEKNKPPREQIQKWIGQVANKEGVRVSKTAIDLIIDRSRYYEDDAINLYAIEIAVRQLSRRGDITEQQVIELYPEEPADKAYKLAGLIAKGDDKAIQEANQLLKEGNAPTMILAMLHKSFRVSWKEKVLGKGCTGVPGFKMTDTGHLSVEQIEKYLNVIDRYYESTKTDDAETSFWLCLSEMVADV